MATTVQQSSGWLSMAFYRTVRACISSWRTQKHIIIKSSVRAAFQAKDRTTDKSCFGSRQGKQIFLFSKDPYRQWAPVRGHRPLASRLKLYGAITPFPHTPSVACRNILLQWKRRNDFYSQICYKDLPVRFCTQASCRARSLYWGSNLNLRG